MRAATRSALVVSAANEVAGVPRAKPAISSATAAVRVRDVCEIRAVVFTVSLSGCDRLGAVCA